MAQRDQRVDAARQPLGHRCRHHPGPHPGHDAGQHHGQLERAERDVPRQRVQVQAGAPRRRPGRSRPGAGSRAAGSGWTGAGRPARSARRRPGASRRTAAQVGQRVAEGGQLPVQHRADRCPGRRRRRGSCRCGSRRAPRCGAGWPGCPRRARSASRVSSAAVPGSVPPASACCCAASHWVPHRRTWRARNPARAAEVGQPDGLRVDRVQPHQHVDQRLAGPAPLRFGVGPARRQLGQRHDALQVVHDEARRRRPAGRRRRKPAPAAPAPPVPASAEITRRSRPMSCAVAATSPTGGRRSTTAPAGLSTR